MSIKHSGGCHCGALRFEVEAPSNLHVYRCNCSICKKKQNDHFIVPASKFKLLQGVDNITTYSIHAHQAKATANAFVSNRNELHGIIRTLIWGADNITTYTFNSHQAKHTFCKTCGVQCFYTPRSNPDGVGVTPHSLDPGTVESVDVEEFDGENWETHIRTTDIQERSKE